MGAGHREKAMAALPLSLAVLEVIWELSGQDGPDPAIATELEEITFSELLRRCAAIGADPCAVFRAASSRVN